MVWGEPGGKKGRRSEGVEGRERSVRVAVRSGRVRRLSLSRSRREKVSRREWR